MSRMAGEKGSILILVLWALGLLTVFAVQIGVSVRQQATLLSRLERRAELRLAAQSGVVKAIAFLRHVCPEGGANFTREQKAKLLNNPEAFSKIKFGKAVVDVVSGAEGQPTAQQYGIIDEERKLNLNRARVEMLVRLFQEVLRVPLEKAQDMARAVVEWRGGGDSTLRGFYSEEYYDNLQFPYPPKKARFEQAEELILVEGFDEPTYTVLKNYVTIYGNGRVNINTASREVLAALGMSPGLRDKVLAARRGLDGEEATEDDFIFSEQNNAGQEFGAFVQLTPAEINELNATFNRGYLGVASEFFRIVSRARLSTDRGNDEKSEKRSISSVFSLKDAKIIYWQEN